MIRHVKFVSVPVRDQDRALNFYTEALGFRLVTDQPMGSGQRWIEIRPPKGNAGLALFTPPGQEHRIGTFLGLSLECDDVVGTYNDLLAKGVRFLKPPEVQPWGTSVILIDSEDNQLVLSTG